ncbi:MAG: carbohydrate kinase [Phaeodactylibacter sp.]|nr:carbohydrate kinase [Phaeodactylibacter sp.]
MTHTAIFDIGKTNKKFFLFDEQFREVYRSYTRLEEDEDEDGFPCENLEQLADWMRATFREALARPEFDIQRLNFSTYGASLVHLDKEGKSVAPLYNYLKPFPEDLLSDFFKRYGPEEEWATETASPVMGMLNSGLQLYWLKYRRPEAFSRIHRSLHLPQYCSCLFSGKYVSEYTSIGCHSGLWDFQVKDYHRWVYQEDIDRLLPPIQPTTSGFDVKIEGKAIKAGVGIHDSSAALLPYIISNTDPFLLISTGTWSITLNPYSQEALDVESLKKDCLNYMRTDGRPARAARLFLGNEYKIWARKLASHFGKPYETHRTVKPNPEILKKLEQLTEPVFRWESIKRPGLQEDEQGCTELGTFSSYEEAYHQLIRELMALQVDTLHLARGRTPVRKIYIDGGFVDNELFLQLLAGALPEYELIKTESPLGSALGAAMVIHNRPVESDFLVKSFSLQKQKAVRL